MECGDTMVSVWIMRTLRYSNPSGWKIEFPISTPGDAYTEVVLKMDVSITEITTSRTELIS